MANLENNNENKNKKSIPKQIEESFEKGMDNLQEKAKVAKELAKDAITHPIETAEQFVNHASKDVVSIKWWARILLYLFWIGFFLVASILVVINLNVTKEWAAKQALDLLNRDFKAQMSTESVYVDFFGDVTIKGLRIKDDRDLDFIKVRELRANSDWFRLAINAISGSNSLSFQSIVLKNADIKVITYKNDSIPNFIRFVEKFDSGKPKDPKKPVFQLDSRVEILDSKVSIVNQNSEGDSGRWLTAYDVNLLAPKVKVEGSNISGRINNFTFKTKRWGKEHFVDTFSSEVSISKEFLQLNDLTINTDHTLLQGDLKFNLDKKTHWTDFTNKVRWEMNLKRGSQISGYDISYFVTNWDNYQPVNISGTMDGTLNDFTLKDFVLGNPQVSIATKKIKLKNLINRNFVIETQSIATDFTYVDLKGIMPSFVVAKMKNIADDFGRLRYDGAVRVMPEQVFVSKGTLVAGIGEAGITDFYLDDFSTSLPKYKGLFEVKNLDVRTITKSPQVGLLSGQFDISGQSFDLNEMKVTTKSQIYSIEILDKILTNIYLDGVLDQKTYNGIINVDDMQARANIQGFVDFKTSTIKADVLADVKNLNISYFTNSKTPRTLSGIINAKVSMTDASDLILNTNAHNLVLHNAGKSYHLANAELKTYLDNGLRTIDIGAPTAVRGKVSGRFQLSDLEGIVENGMQKILVGQQPRRLYSGQNLNFDFDVRQTLVNFIDPNLKIPDGATLAGQYDGNDNSLIFNADVSDLRYFLANNSDAGKIQETLVTHLTDELSSVINDTKSQKYNMLEASGISLKINTANVEQQIKAEIQRLKYEDNIFQNITLNGRNENDQTLHLAMNFLYGESAETMKDFAINLNQSTNEAGDYVIHFEPTEIKINQVTWAVDTNPELNHSVTYRKNNGDFLVENLRIYSDESSLLIDNARFKSAKDFHAEGQIDNLQIGKLLEMLKNGNTMNMRGIADGSFNFTMNNSDLQPLIDLKIKDMTMNENPMGDIVISAKNSDKPNIYDVEGRVVASEILGNNNLHITGTIDNNPKTPTLDIQADMKDFDLAFSQQFVNGIFSNMRGKANGLLNISGPINDVDYSGDINMKGFGFKLDFTGVDYSFEDNIIPLSNGLAVLNDIKIKDERGNSGGTISGAIYFETLASMAVQLIMRADNLMVLNTQQKDFDLFWGRVYGQGNLYVSGPVSGLSISTDIQDPFKALNNSTFTFNAGSTSGVDQFKMLRFLKENETGEVTIEERKKTGVNMDLDFNVAVDRRTTVNVLLPQNTGNISVRGEANPLRFRMSKTGTIAMNGVYTVDNGTFVSKSILERTFQITRGSKMQWDGDAMTPALGINANYTRAVSNAGQYLGVQTLPPVNVILGVNIVGTLNSPEMTLGVSAPDLSSQLKETLAGKMSNYDEVVIQFGSILVLNSFNVQDTDGFDIDVIGQVESQGYNLLFKQLGSVLNTISNQFQVDLNYLKGDTNSNMGDRANASVSIALSPRVTLKTGLGVPISTGAQNSNYNNYLSGEGTIEYDWSKKNDKTRMFRAYSKPSNIGLVAGTTGNSAANQTYGVGVVYSKSFDTLFKRKNKKSVKKKTDSSAVDTDSLR